MMRQRAYLFAGLVTLILGVGLMTAQEKQPAKDKDPKREADVKAIEKLSQDLIQAFANRDAAAVAINWTVDGEFIRNDGDPLRGRLEIQKAYAEYFKTLTGKPKLEIQSDGLRFPSPDLAMADVTLRLKSTDGELIASSWRNTLLVRDGAQWKIAVVREYDRDIGQDVSLKELEWLIGTWQASNKDREVISTYEWDENKVFIRGKYTVKEGAKVVESGTQMIGKDNNDGVIRSWVFQSDGGFGGGVWTRDGKKWLVDVQGTLPSGKEVTGNTIYVHVDANTYTWQAVNQKIDDDPIADTLPVKVTKQKK